MTNRQFYYIGEMDLQSDPAQLWPLVANTNRFDRDAGLPSIQEASYEGLDNARLRGHLSIYGVPLSYVQEPFEWEFPHRLGVTRHYSSGPVSRLRVLIELNPRPGGGTHLRYHIWASPAMGIIGWIGIPVQIGLIYRRRFLAVLRQYDQMVAADKPDFSSTGHPKLAPGAASRLDILRKTLIDQGADPTLLAHLIEVIRSGDDVAVAGLRPYALADGWGVDRRATLELCLLATRAGMLDSQWEVLCPLCRADKTGGTRLDGIASQLHCEACNIDFTANFEQSVEITFRPNPSIRTVELHAFCIDMPTKTPHVVTQKLLAPGESYTATPILEPGRYRLRALDLPGGQAVQVTPDGPAEATFTVGEQWPAEVVSLGAAPQVHFANSTNAERLLIFERMAWSDQAAVAAEVTVLQRFRDLFADDLLRPGEQVSVGSLAVVFTDLRGSTALYRQIGDAAAFGRVMSHFDILKDAIATEGGGIVKTIGDAVMAVFRRPAPALRAMLRAQRALASPDSGGPKFALRVGIHYGPSIAVTLNERLDYFGSTINMAARFEGISSGKDIIISRAAADDPEVIELLHQWGDEVTVEAFTSELKGFEHEQFELLRIGG